MFYAIPRFGDINLDGKNDLILNVVQSNKNQTLIFLNSPCKDNNNVNDELCRYFDSSETKD